MNNWKSLPKRIFYKLRNVLVIGFSPILAMLAHAQIGGRLELSPEVYALPSGAEFLFLDTKRATVYELYDALPAVWTSSDNTKLDLVALFLSYPDDLVGLAFTPSRLWVLSYSGKAVLYHALKQEPAEHHSLRQTMAIPYDLGAPPEFIKDQGQDPGRLRSEPLLRALYGDSALAVAAGLEQTAFAGKKVRFNRRANAAMALANVNRALGDEYKKPAMAEYVKTLGGTFNWRKVAGSNQLSAHAFGIAIDLNPELGNYWRWYKGDLATYSRAGFPAEIVAAFEAEGFIWGGKWHHFDLMHFEYRPEIIKKASLALRAR